MADYIHEFESHVAGIPCIIGVTYWENYDAGRSSGPVESCYPPEGGCGDWRILDSKGRYAEWLERKMTQEDRVRIDEQVFNEMEMR